MDSHRRLYVGLPLRRSVLSILVLLLALPCLDKLSQAQNTPSTTVPSTYFGMTFNKGADAASPLPEPVTAGMLRIWDSGVGWPNIETANGTYNWTPLETLLKNAYDDGITTAIYTMSRTPQWALDLVNNCTSNPNQPACDTTCNYYDTGGVTTGAGAPGQCYPPSDINPDGTGTDAMWKAWVTALGQEATTLCNEGGYACIKYFEIWNEVDRNSQGSSWFANQSGYSAPYMFGNGTSGHGAQNSGNSYRGSYAQLVRMTQDARCLLMGQTSLRTKGSTLYAIDNAGSGGVGSYEECPTTTAKGPAGSEIVLPSSHPQAPEGLNTSQNILYCTYGSPSTGAPNYCNTGNDEAYSVDIVNMHMKPGNNSDGWYEEDEMLKQYCAVEGGCDSETGILQTREQGFPFWNDESGYSGANGDAWNGAGGAMSIGQNPDMQASFIARYALTQWSLGIGNYDWYAYDLSNSINGGSANGTGSQAGDPALAETSVATWLIGQTMTSGGVATPCSAASDPAGKTDSNGNPTLWTCSLQGPNSFVGEPIWDSFAGTGGYTCASGSYEGDNCTYYTYTVPSTWHFYRDLWGNETAITNNQVQISNLPIMLENKRLGN